MRRGQRTDIYLNGRKVAVSVAGAAVVLAGLGTAQPATASSDPSSGSVEEAAGLVLANSQERAEILGGEATVTSAAPQAGALSKSQRTKESALRSDLAAGDPLQAGNVTLNVGTGEITQELLSSETLAEGRLKLKLRETAEYPYLDGSSSLPMGEGYTRVATLAPAGESWTIESNYVEEGTWPLLEGGATQIAQVEAADAEVVEETGDAGVGDDYAGGAGFEGPAYTPPAAAGDTVVAGTTRQDAVDYALRYALKYNTNYSISRGADCTNFVSQALKAGGFLSRNVDADRTSLWAWWYDFDAKPGGWHDWSNTWKVANHNYRFHLNTKRGTVIWQSGASEIIRGDLVYADWTNDGIKDHVWITTGYASDGMRLMSGHAHDRRNARLDFLIAEARESHGSLPTYRYMRMNWGKF